jgi:peptidoglycan-associated lipoprotein
VFEPSFNRSNIRSREDEAMTRSRATQLSMAAIVIAALLAGACGKKQPPVARPMPPPGSGTGTTTPPPPEPVGEPVPVPPEPVAEDAISGKSLDDLNRDSPLQPVFFLLDSNEISGAGQSALQNNAQILKKYPGWQITIEGHCDERGTPEYNLGLGERRAIAARDYLVSLGIPADRVRTVSYGKEFPFDPGHDESAWSKNRRAHFVITAK